MHNVLLSIFGLLNTKMVISDDLLVLCFEFCNQMSNSNNGLMTKFTDTLTKCVHDCLTNKNLRNFFYFRQFLLFSNVWFCKNGNDGSV